MTRLAHALGWVPHPWQITLWDLALTINEAGTGWQYPTVIVTTPRRSGKTRAVSAAMVHRGLTFPKSRTFYTAQTGQDARDWWRDAVAELGGTPLAGRFSLRRSAGSEAITWPNGSSLRVFSPQPDALHGKDTDLVIVDESWAFSSDRGRALVQAISPTQLTRPWGQMWWPSTAGDESSDFLRDLVDRGRASLDDPDATIAYLEWSCPPELDPLDPDSWPQFHPAYGLTVSHDALKAELERMGPADFARAYGNVWPSMNAGAGWGAGVWEAAASDEAPTGSLSWGADVSLDRDRATIAVCGHGKDGLVVEIVNSCPPMDAAPMLREYQKRHGGTIYVNPYGPAVTLGDELNRAKADFASVGSNDYAAACAGLFDGIRAGTVSYRQDPDLDAAAATAGRRSIGERWAWARKNGVDVSPLTAATLAVFGATRPSETAPAPTWYVPGS